MVARFAVPFAVAGVFFIACSSSNGSGGSGSCSQLLLCCASASYPAADVPSCTEAAQLGIATTCSTFLTEAQASGCSGTGLRDSGLPSLDTGLPPLDAGPPGTDATLPHPDSGPVSNDAGTCKQGGSSCTTFIECCSGTCANDVCTSCAGVGQSCEDETCCNGLTCSDDVCGNCRAEGSPCTGPADCCSNVCSNGACAACNALGQSCDDQNPCCGGLSCESGVCLTQSDGGRLADSAAGCEMLGSAGCAACCNGLYQGGSQVFIQGIKSCGCAAGAACESACASTLCAGEFPGSGSPCFMCIDGSDESCLLESESNCTGNTACDDWLHCIMLCGQGG